MAKGSKSSPGKARSAITGHYVKPSYAKTHPNITVIERDKPKGGGKGGKKK
jgi:hypothetical protein